MDETFCGPTNGKVWIRVVHGSDGPAGRVGSRFCRNLASRVESGQHFGFISFYTDYFLVPDMNLRILSFGLILIDI